MDPVWLGDKGPSGHSSAQMLPFSSTVMGMGMQEAEERGSSVPPIGFGAHISPQDDSISITLKGSSIYAAIF